MATSLTDGYRNQLLQPVRDDDALGIIMRERQKWLDSVPATVDPQLRSARTPQEMLQLLQPHLMTPDERTDPEEMDAFGR